MKKTLVVLGVLGLLVSVPIQAAPRQQSNNSDHGKIATSLKTGNNGGQSQQTPQVDYGTWSWHSDVLIDVLKQLLVRRRST